jgi:polysaccharide deacetylase 2 family uncharacterized protein YibQ
MRGRAFAYFLCAAAAVGFAACRTKEPAAAGETGSANTRSRAGKALSAREFHGASRLAIVIDDLGYDRAAAEAVFRIKLPLTLAVLPHLPYSVAIAQEAYRRGIPVLLHLPMESAEADAKRESIELHTGMTQEEAARMVAGMLETVPHAVGANNHQGSRATLDPALMAALMPVLRDRGLFFIDSRTSVDSQAYRLARHAGVPAAYRSVFLDDTPAREATLRQLHLAVDEARRQGWAIAIGHPHPSTFEALREFLPGLGAQGVQLVYVSELAREPD